MFKNRTLPKIGQLTIVVPPTIDSVRQRFVIVIVIVLSHRIRRQIYLLIANFFGLLVIALYVDYCFPGDGTGVKSFIDILHSCLICLWLLLSKKERIHCFSFLRQVILFLFLFIRIKSLSKHETVKAIFGLFGKSRNNRSRKTSSIDVAAASADTSINGEQQSIVNSSSSNGVDANHTTQSIVSNIPLFFKKKKFD